MLLTRQAEIEIRVATQTLKEPSVSDLMAADRLY